MSSNGFTPQAIDDLVEIWSYIGTDDVDAADRVEEAIYAACAFLTNSPLAGRVRDDLTPCPSVSGWPGPTGILPQTLCKSVHACAKTAPVIALAFAYSALPL